MKRILPLLAAFIFPAAALAEQPDADVYDLQVVLRFGAHNWLGRHYREDFAANLKGMLTDALGPMAKVSVTDMKTVPPASYSQLWKDVDLKGLAALDRPVETAGSKSRAVEGTGVKTHFVFVDYDNGQYEIQTRQHDGQTGVVSPWRHERIADRAFVARVAVKLIAEDFGLVCRVSLAGRNDKVRVDFKGASQGASIDRWVQRGDIFALVQVDPTGGKEMIYPVNDTLVQLTDDPKGGECPARVVSRAEKNPMLAAPRGHTFRCIRLGAVQGPLRLRLVDASGLPHKSALQLWVHTEAFQTGPPKDEEVINSDRGGSFLSVRNYDRIAFVRIITGGVSIAQVPVPIQDQEVTVQIGLNKTQEAVAQLLAEVLELTRQYREVRDMQRRYYESIGKIESNDLALKAAKNARSSLESDMERLKDRKTALKARLANDPDNKALPKPITLDEADQIEAELELRKKALNRLIGQLEEFKRFDDAPDRKERRQKVAEIQEKVLKAYDDCEFDTMIDLLRAAVKEYPEARSLKTQLDKMESEWKIRSNEHNLARQFLVKEWPTLKTAADIGPKLATARQKIAVCVKVGDNLTIRKFHKYLGESAKALAEEVKTLEGDDSDEAAAKKKKIDAVIADLLKVVELVEKSGDSNGGK
jgi:hypothetical protein